MDIGEIPEEDKTDIYDFLTDYNPVLSIQDTEFYEERKNSLDEAEAKHRDLLQQIEDNKVRKAFIKKEIPSITERIAELKKTIGELIAEKENHEEDTKNALGSLTEQIKNATTLRDDAINFEDKVKYGDKVKILKDELDDLKEKRTDGMTQIQQELSGAKAEEKNLLQKKKELETELEELEALEKESKKREEDQAQLKMDLRQTVEELEAIIKFRDQIRLRYLKTVQAFACLEYDNIKIHHLNMIWTLEDTERKAQEEYENLVVNYEREKKDSVFDLIPGSSKPYETAIQKKIVGLLHDIVKSEEDLRREKDKLKQLESTNKTLEKNIEKINAYLEELESVAHLEARLFKKREAELKNQEKNLASIIENSRVQLETEKEQKEKEKLLERINECKKTLKDLRKEIEVLKSKEEERKKTFNLKKHLGQEKMSSYVREHNATLASLNSVTEIIDKLNGIIKKSQGEVKAEEESGERKLAAAAVERERKDKEMAGATALRQKEAAEFAAKIEKSKAFINKPKDEYIYEVMYPIPEWTNGEFDYSSKFTKDNESYSFSSFVQGVEDWVLAAAKAEGHNGTPDGDEDRFSGFGLQTDYEFRTAYLWCKEKFQSKYDLESRKKRLESQINGTPNDVWWVLQEEDNMLDVLGQSIDPENYPTPSDDFFKDVYYISSQTGAWSEENISIRTYEEMTQNGWVAFTPQNSDPTSWRYPALEFGTTGSFLDMRDNFTVAEDGDGKEWRILTFKNASNDRRTFKEMKNNGWIEVPETDANYAGGDFTRAYPALALEGRYLDTSRLIDGSDFGEVATRGIMDDLGVKWWHETLAEAKARQANA